MPSTAQARIALRFLRRVGAHLRLDNDYFNRMDALNYAIGHFVGPRVFERPDSRFLRQEHLRKSDHLNPLRDIPHLEQVAAALVELLPGFVDALTSRAVIVTYTIVGSLFVPFLAVSIREGFEPSDLAAGLAAAMAVSESGASITRHGPNSSWKPSVTLKAPP